MDTAVPTMTTLQRIEESQGKLLAAINALDGQVTEQDNLLARGLDAIALRLEGIESKVSSLQGQALLTQFQQNKKGGKRNGNKNKR